MVFAQKIFFYYSSNNSKNLFELISFKLREGEYELCLVDSLEDVLETPGWACLVELDQESLIQNRKTLSVITRRFPTIIGVEESDFSFGMDLVNNLKAFAVIGPNHSEKEFDIVFQRLLHEKQKNEGKLQGFSQSRDQNKELELMTQDLEKIVINRTREIQGSKNLIANKVLKMKGLVAFIKSLSSILKVEDLLLLIRSEIHRSYGKIEPILAYDAQQSGGWLLSFERGEVISRSVSDYWSSGERLKINLKEDQLYLANQYSRPFQRVITFPLQGHAENPHNVVLFVEHNLKDDQIENFINFMGERLQSLSLALDRSLLEIDLKRASYIWESTFNSLDDPIAVFSDENSVLRSNLAFQKFFGDSDMSLDQILSEQDIKSPIQQSMESRQPSLASIKLGHQFFEWHCYPIGGSHSSIVASVVSHFVDVTHYKNLQSTMIQNEKMSAMGHLAGNIAHELNNPLTGIRSLCQILISDTQQKEEVLNDLKEVESAAERSQKIITNLLNFARGAEQSEKEVVSLNNLIEKTLPLLKSVTSAHQRIFSLESKNELVQLEPHLTQQVIFNLINNACQSMEEPGELRVATKVISNKIRFLVEDTGPGIPEDIQNSIFDPFFTTKSGRGGTGLGLSMSQSVIESFGGHIKFETHSGKGTKFWFDLPIYREENK